jgi:hypothetical protein
MPKQKAPAPIAVEPPKPTAAELAKADRGKRIRNAARSVVAADRAGMDVEPDERRALMVEEMPRIDRAIAAVKSGNLASVTEILMGQLMSLDAAYHHQLRLGAVDRPDNKYAVAAFDRALDFQKASLKTARAIADISRPKNVTFVKTQQNLTVEQSDSAAPQLPQAQGEIIPVDVIATSPAIDLVHQDRH